MPHFTDTFEARRWKPSNWVAGNGWPEIETVWTDGSTPTYGIIHAVEGDIVVNVGEWIAPLGASYAVYGVSEIGSRYRQVQ